MKLHPLYKRLMLLLIVIGPFFWLVFTTDGQRRVDLVLLSLWRGGATMDVAFAKLREDARESDLRGSFPDVPLSCEDRTNPFGNRICTAPIASFNGAPASYAVAYFDAGRLTALKLAYRRPYHDYVGQQLLLELGQPVSDDAGVWRWSAGDGLVLLPVQPPAREEPTVLWLSRRQALQAAAQ